MKRPPEFAVVLSLLVGGCAGSTTTTDITDRFPQFEATTKSQNAIFLTQSWTGGGGDPLQTKRRDRPAKVDGLPVLLLSDTQKLIRKGLGKQPADCKDGAILVEARIHLKRTSVSMSVPGGGSRAAYAVIIEELLSSNWYTGG